MKLLKEIESRIDKEGIIIKYGKFGNKNSFKHGGTHTKLYNMWLNIKQRCLNPKNYAYKDYGGRGITICPEWTNDYVKFRDWSLVNGYQEGLEIDRINNDKGYSPDNCNFVTKVYNRRKTRRIKVTLGIANEIRYLYKICNYAQKELAKKFNVSQATVSDIINNKSWV